MQLIRVTMFVLAATGCANDATERPLPGVRVADELGATSIEDHDPHECSYEQAEHDPRGMVPDFYQKVTRTYDANGLVAMRQAVDRRGAVVWTETNEYSALGKIMHRDVQLTSGKTIQIRLAYDSFGRKVRYSSDLDSDGVEEVVVTYGYADDSLVRTLHRVDRGQATDQTNSYDDLGRMIAIDMTGAFPGTLTISYDDAARTETTAFVGRDDHYTGVTTYDDQNRELTYTEIHTDPVSGATAWSSSETVSYPSSSLTTLTGVNRTFGPGGTVTDELNTRFDYHFGSCD
jgi:hypothetical protein